MLPLADADSTELFMFAGVAPVMSLSPDTARNGLLVDRPAFQMIAAFAKGMDFGIAGIEPTAGMTKLTLAKAR